jgi:hypothetical protein
MRYIPLIHQNTEAWNGPSQDAFRHLAGMRIRALGEED